MKYAITVAFLLTAILSYAQSNDLPSPLIDPRDGLEYQTVQIGNQIWMAENLRFETKGSEPNENSAFGFNAFPLFW